MNTKYLRIVFLLLLLAPPASIAVLVSHGVSAPLALTLAVVGLIVGVTGLERIRPFRRDWSIQPREETVTDVLYIALASVPDRLTRVAIEALALILLGAAATTATTASMGYTAVAALLAFVVADFGKYWIHRVSHSWPWLWRFHLAHHQPARVSALNALRLHPVNMAYNAAIDTVPLLVLGVSPGVAAVLAGMRATVGVVQHANLDLESGRQWLVNAPSYHRVHHDIDASRAHANFGSTLLVWDRLFATLRRGQAPSEVGVQPSAHRLPKGYLGQLVYPWCGERLDTTCRLAWVPWLVR